MDSSCPRVTIRAALIVNLISLPLVAAMILLVTSPRATGYEVTPFGGSLADTLPLIGLSILGGTGLLVLESASGQDRRVRALGLATLLIASLVFLSFPIARGFLLYGTSDTVAHLKWSRIILQTAHFHEENRYPIVHILTAQMAQVTGMPVETALKVVPLLFYTLYVISTYLLASAVWCGKRVPVLAVCLASVLFQGYYHVALYPQAMALMVFPLTFFLYFKTRLSSSFGFGLLFVIVLLVHPFLHPVTALVLIFSLLGMEVAKLGLRGRRREIAGSAKRLANATFAPTLISGVTFFLWISSFGFFTGALRNTLLWLQGEVRFHSRLGEAQGLMASLGLGLQDQASLALKMYGDCILLILLSALGMVRIYRDLRRRDSDAPGAPLLVAAMVASGVSWIFVFLSTHSVTVGRLLGSNAAMWASPVLGAIGVDSLLRHGGRPRAVAAFAIVLCTIWLGGYGVYHHPGVLQASWQITASDAAGFDWFSARAPGGVATGGLGIPPAFLPDHPTDPVELLAARDSVGEGAERAYLLVSERFTAIRTDPILSRRALNDPRILAPGIQLLQYDALAHSASTSIIYDNGIVDVYLLGTR